ESKRGRRCFHSYRSSPRDSLRRPSRTHGRIGICRSGQPSGDTRSASRDRQDAAFPRVTPPRRRSRDLPPKRAGIRFGQNNFPSRERNRAALALSPLFDNEKSVLAPGTLGNHSPMPELLASRSAALIE